MSTFKYPPDIVGDVANANPRDRRKIRIGARVSLAMFVLLVLGQFVVAAQGFFSSQQVEKQDPEQVFHRVFKDWPPVGVTEIKAAGQIGYGGTAYWMVIRTTDMPALMSVLGRIAKPTDLGALRKFEPCTDALKRKAAAVDWESSHSVNKPEYYESAKFSGWSTFGLIVDKARKSVYVGVIEN